MDFARFNIYHADARGSYRTIVKNENDPNPDFSFHCPEIDTMKMNFLPLSFFHLLKASYQFTDPYVAMSIVPDDFNESQMKPLLVNLAAAGFVYKNDGDLKNLIMRHYDFATKYVSNEQFDEFLGKNSIEENSFSFASTQLAKIYKFFHKEEKNFILLFNTPAGFAVYRPSLISMNETHNIGIILSKKEIVNCDIANFTIQLCTPSSVLFQAIRDEKAISFCEFSLVQGTWQPKLNLDIISQIFTNINPQFNCTRDCCTINFSAFAGMRSRIIGLIGRYSDIIKLFSPKDPNQQVLFVNLLNRVRQQLNPQIFYIPYVTRSNDSSATKKRRGFSYVILYIPDDFMPNHPHYREVTEYAYSFMRRACTLTLLVPNFDEEPQPCQIFNHIQGLINQANFAELLFFGSGESQIITLCNQILLNSMEFDDLSDLISWMNWISPFYNFDFSKLQFQIFGEGITFNEDAALNLIENETLYKNGERHFIDKILYGDYEHKSPEEIAEIILKTKTKDSDISKLISDAVNLSKIANEMRRPACAVCNHRDNPKWTDDQKIQERTNHEFDALCPWCCLKKLEAQNKGESPEAQPYLGNIRGYNAKETAFNKDLKNFIDILIQKSKQSATAAPSVYINIDPVLEFVKWFFEFWCKYNLEAKWDELDKGNILQLNHFDNVSRDESGKITEDMNQCISTLSGEHFNIDSNFQKQVKDVDPYLQKLIAVSKMYGHILESNQVFEGFKSFLVKKITELIKTVKPLPYKDFESKCMERLAQLKKKYKKGDEKTKFVNKKDNPTITFESIMATNKMTLNVVVDNEKNYLDFRDYTFNYVDQLIDEKFSSKQLQGDKAAFLIHQPYHMKIINSWRVQGGVLALIAIGDKARLIFLPQNFRGRFIDHYLYETTITDSDRCYASFAPRPYTLCIVSDSTNPMHRYIVLLQVSLDFSSAVEVKRRPLECLLPLPSLNDTRKSVTTLITEEEEDDEDEDDESSKKKRRKKKKKKSKREEEIINVETSFNGFIIDENATRGALGATIKCGTGNFVPINFLIEFDPTKLSITKIHRLEFNFQSFPVYPLHFISLPLSQIKGEPKENSEKKEGEGNQQNNNNNNKNPEKKEKVEMADCIVCISNTTNLNQAQNILIFSEKAISIIQRHLDGLGDRIMNKIGVSYYEGKNILVFATKNQPPTLQSSSKQLPIFPDFNDMFTINFDTTSIPEFVAGCNMKYGYSEIERVLFPTHLPYPVELVKFDILNTLDGSEMTDSNVKLYEAIKSAMLNVVPLKDGWSAPFRIYKQGQLTATNEPDLSDFFGGKSNYEAIINFATRIVSIPQAFVNSIPKPPADAAKYDTNSIVSMAVRMMLNFPPLPLLRGAYKRKAMTISLVDIGKDAEGSSIISSIGGIPFTKCLPGCVNVGVSYTPIFNPDHKKFPLFEPDKLTIRSKSVISFDNIILCHFRPDRLEVPASNFVTLFCAMKCSDVVIVNAGKQTQFLIDVLKLFIELVSPFDLNYGGKLFDDSIKNNDDDDDDDDSQNDDEENNENNKNGIVDKNSIFPILKGLAFVTELGNDPIVKIHEIERILTKELAFRDEQTVKVFENKITFVPSEYTVFEIARSIANEQFLNNKHLSNLRPTKDAYKSLIKSCGYFGSILSHIDNIMYTDKDEDEEAPQDEGDEIIISDDEEEEEEDKKDDDDDE